MVQGVTSELHWLMGCTRTNFLRKWGEKKDHLYLFTEHNKYIPYFIKIINKIYNNIPIYVKKSQPSEKITFVGSFDPYFPLLLREGRATTLIDMQYDAIEIDSNMIT